MNNLFNQSKLSISSDKPSLLKTIESLKIAGQIINYATDVIIICEAEPDDEPGPRIVYVNEAFVKETGYTFEEVLGKTLLILQGPKTDPVVTARIREALKKCQPVREKVLNYKKNGEEFWMSLNIFPISNDLGCFTHWIAIQHNINDSMFRELELSTARKKLIHLNQELLVQKNLAIQLQHKLQEILMIIPDPIFELGLDGTYYECYATKTELLAAPRELLIGKKVSDVLPGDACEIVMSALQTANLTGQSLNQKFSLTLPQGSHWFELTVVKMDDAANSNPRFIVLSRDVTERHNRDHKLRQSDQDLRFILENSPISIRITNKATGLLVFANTSYCNFVQMSKQDLMGLDPKQFYFLEEVDNDLTENKTYTDNVQNLLVKLNIRNKVKWGIASRIEMIFEGDSVSLGWFYDVTRQKELEQALQDSEERFKFSFKGSGDGLWDWNVTNGEVIYSTQWKSMLGFTKTEIKNDFNEWKRLVHPDDLPVVMSDIKAYLDGEISNYTCEHRLRCKDGSYKWILTRGIITARDDEGQATRMNGTHTDISSLKNRQSELTFLATHDTLTQLPNRSLLFSNINHGILRANRAGNHLALLMIDLDHFKKVNDNFGHQAGDDLLKQVALRLANYVRGIDTICRLGGDEFVVLIEDIVDINDIDLIADKIITALSAPYHLNQKIEVSIGASIGIASYPGYGTTPDLLLAQADSALYKAKNKGRGGFTYFSAQDAIAASTTH